MTRQLGQREALVSLKVTATPSSPGGSLDSAALSYLQASMMYSNLRYSGTTQTLGHNGSADKSAKG
jgi:hypothetical protein